MINVACLLSAKLNANRKHEKCFSTQNLRNICIIQLEIQMNCRRKFCRIVDCLDTLKLIKSKPISVNLRDILKQTAVRWKFYANSLWCLVFGGVSTNVRDSQRYV